MAITAGRIARRARRAREQARLAWPNGALAAMAQSLEGAVALEPGGPSGLLGRRGLVRVYPRLAALDTLDYTERTLWSHGARPEIEIRARLIGEAGRLTRIAAESYDAVLASHVVEHLANPLGALVEWRRVVRRDGHLLLIVPHRDGTFDHRRPVTTLQHLREDAERETGEDDLTHLQEILELHDLARDWGAGGPEAFASRSRENATFRALHHHVFVSRSVVELCRAAGLRVLALCSRRPFHIVCLCRVGGGADVGEGERLLAGRGPGTSEGASEAGELGERELAEILRRSPFPSDRRGS